MPAADGNAARVDTLALPSSREFGRKASVTMSEQLTFDLQLHPHGVAISPVDGPAEGGATPEQAEMIQQLMADLSAGTLSMSLTAPWLYCSTCRTRTTQNVHLHASMPSRTECQMCHVEHALSEEQKEAIYADWRTIIERVQARRDPAQNPTPNPFDAATGVAPFASGAPVLGACHAIGRASRWTVAENGSPQYVHRMDSGNMRFAYTIMVPPYNGLQPGGDDETTVAERDIAFQLLRGMGPDTLALHMAVSVYCMQTERGDAAAIERSVVYWALGLNKRKDMSREEKDRRCWEEVRRLSSIGLTILQLKSAGFRSVDYRQLTTPLWTISTDRFGQLRLDDACYEDWQLLCRPGEWGDLFLYRKPRRQFGYLSKGIIEKIDRHRAPWALHLGVLLSFDARFEPQEWISVRNGRLLEFVGMDASELANDRKKRNEAKNQLLNAISEMAKWGCEVDYSAWPSELRPDLDACHADALEDRPGDAMPRPYPRGYWDRLLLADTRFRLPSAVIDNNLLTKAKFVRRTANHSFGADSVRELRESMGWTKARMARELGVTSAAITQWENSKRGIGPRHQEKLQVIRAAATDFRVDIYSHSSK